MSIKCPQPSNPLPAPSRHLAQNVCTACPSPPDMLDGRPHGKPPWDRIFQSFFISFENDPYQSLRHIIYICIYMYVCKYVCMYVCKYVSMYVCMDGWMDVCM